MTTFAPVTPGLMIRSSVIRLGIFVSALIIIAIIIFQLVWLQKTYRLEQKEFDINVTKVIRGLYEDLDMSSYNSANLNELIEKPEPHLYIFKIDLPVNADTLKYYLQSELEDFDVFTDCHLSIYYAGAGRVVYTDLLASLKTEKKTHKPAPLITRPYNYASLYFPNRQGYILSRLNIWIISSILMMIVLIIFSAGLFYFYRQKFISETQRDFVHNFAHEFKTPVSVISLAADTILSKAGEKNEKLNTYAGIIRDQSIYLNTQIEKLLQFAYTESKHLQLNKHAVNMHEAIQEAISNLRPLIEERKAILQLDLNAANPVVPADKNYILIVLMNLIDNAIKYSRNPAIVISTSSEPGHFAFSIKDNGVGIERAQLGKIFKKFYRVKTGEVYSSKGFGIGLSFVKKILDAHHATIKVESIAGGGSIFIVIMNT